VLWFEVLRICRWRSTRCRRVPGPDAELQMTESMIAVATVMAACLILLLVYFVWPPPAAQELAALGPRLVASLGALRHLADWGIIGESGAAR